MALSGQRQGDSTSRPDEHFPFLTVPEADRLRSLARQAFAATGREVILYGGHVIAYVRKLITHVDHHHLGGLTAEEVRSRTYAKLVAASVLSDSAHGLGYARDIMPGLIDKLVLDFPDVVSWLRDAEVERYGGYAVLREAARPTSGIFPSRSASR